MSRSTIIISTVLLVLLIAVGGIYLYLRQFMPKYEWYPQYRELQEEPYDLSVLYSMTENNPDIDFKLIDEATSTLLDSTDFGSTYLYIGYYRNNLDSAELEVLKRFAKNGNDVVLMTDGFDSFTFKKLLNYPKDTTADYYYSTGSEAVIDSIIHPEVVNSNHNFKFHYKSISDTVPTSWSVLSAGFFT